MFYVPYTYTATQRRNTAPISSNKTAETVGQSIYYLPYTKGSRCITCPCLHITSLFLSAAGPIVSCIIVQATLPSIYTSGQSNLTTGRIAAAHGRFNGIRQVAPVCTLSNTCFHGPTRVQILNSVLISSAIFAQLTTECPYTLQSAAPSPSKFPSHGDLDPI